MNPTTADLIAIEARLARNRKGQIRAAIGPPASREADLHDEIAQFCRERGWLVIHSRMDRATTQACGVCDFIVFATKGRVFLVEAKSRGGKLSVAQQAFAAHARLMGQTVHIVHNRDEFREAVK